MGDNRGRGAVLSAGEEAWPLRSVIRPVGESSVEEAPATEVFLNNILSSPGTSLMGVNSVQGSNETQMSSTTTIALDRETKSRLDDVEGASYDEKLRNLLSFHEEHQVSIELSVDDRELVDQLIKNLQ